MADSWTIRSMLSWCEGYLSRHGDASARHSAEMLIAHACELDRIALYLDMDRPLEPAELDFLREAVRRRGQGEPLQYITGTAPFRYLELKVAPGVLIPRPETEVLVSEALALLPPAPKPQDTYDAKLLEAFVAARKDAEAAADAETVGAEAAADGNDAVASEYAANAEEATMTEAAGGIAAGETGAGTSVASEAAAATKDSPALLLVADICTGTGCIACSIASEHELTRVFATDISPEAIALANENVADCGLVDRVSVLECDLGSGLPTEYAGALDLVVSNPPYVPTAVIAEIPHEVSGFEPALALDGGADGLDIFRRLAPWAFENLKPGGGFACELHETCLDEAAAFAREAGFTGVRIVRDLAGRPRVLVARKPETSAAH